MRKRNSNRRNRFGTYEDRTFSDRNLYDSNTRSYGAGNLYDSDSRSYSRGDHYDDVADEDNYSVGRWSSGSDEDRRDMRNSRRDFDENIFQRAGRKIRHAWDRMTDDESDRYMDEDKDFNESYGQYERPYRSRGRRWNVNDESFEYGRYGERNRPVYGNQDPSFTGNYDDRGAYDNTDYDYRTERNRDQYLDDSVNNSYGDHPARYYDDRYMEHNIDRARRALRGQRLRRGRKERAW